MISEFNGDAKLKDVLRKFDTENPCRSSVAKIKSLCCNYLGGRWESIQEDDFTIKPIVGGLTNFLYLLELSPHVKGSEADPRQVLLRIYNQDDPQQILMDSIVFTIFSERSLGPNLLGAFLGGRFEEYLPSRTLNFEEINDQRYFSKIAKLMAQVHCLNVPIKKKPEIVTNMRKWLNAYRTSSGNADLDLSSGKKYLSECSQFPSSISCDDLEKELLFVEHFLENCGSPVVFSHNDIHGGNILLLENFTINKDGSVLYDGKPSSDEPLVMIDFEFCNYNYRGFDIGNFFCEQGFNYAYHKPPYYKIIIENLERSTEQKIFCEAYLDKIFQLSSHCQTPQYVTGDRDMYLHHLMMEAEVFMNISHLFWAMFTARASKDPSFAGIKLDFEHNSSCRTAFYLANKPKMEDYLQKRRNYHLSCFDVK